MRRRHPSFEPGAFTLIELLVVVAVVSLLLGVLAPALSSARRSAESARCASNLRQAFLACRSYADDSAMALSGILAGGLGPAIGEPYAELPNWALVVQSYADRIGSTPGELYSNTSVLVCPAADAHYPQAMTRTYAMNGTGHAGLAAQPPTEDDPGWPADPDNYDDPDNPAHIRFDRVQRPTETPLLLDSAIASFPSNAPPPTRTASIIDFRQPEHVAARIGRFHAGGREFNCVRFDGSVRAARDPAPHWRRPLP